jgi:hypothetical protein
VDLLSINQALEKGYRISNDKIIISLSKGLNKITFDRFFKAKDGTVSGILMRPCDNPVAYTILNGVTKKGIEINDFHTMLGHCGSDMLERTARIHCFKLFGELKTCKQCAISKARQKNIKKEWKGSSQIPGERLYIDINSIKNATFIKCLTLVLRELSILEISFDWKGTSKHGPSQRHLLKNLMMITMI